MSGRTTCWSTCAGDLGVAADLGSGEGVALAAATLRARGSGEGEKGEAAEGEKCWNGLHGGVEGNGVVGEVVRSLEFSCSVLALTASQKGRVCGMQVEGKGVSESGDGGQKLESVPFTSS